MSETTEAGQSEEWVRPRPSRTGYRNDLLLALALAVGTTITLVLFRATGTFGTAPGWQAAIWIVAATMPLALRRRWPEVVALISSLAFAAAYVFEIGEMLFSQICLFVAIYSVGAWGRNRRIATIVRAVIVSAMLAWVFWQLIYYSAVQDYLPELPREGALSPYLAYGLINIITNLLYFGGAWFFGDSAYRSARARALLEQRTIELAEERERTKQQALALERVRIARELHDVVAHHVSVMGVQAGAARRVLERDPAQASASLSLIEQNARSAVDELHLLLGTLRSEQQETGPVPAQSSSTRGIEQLAELVADAAGGGLPVELSIIGEPRAVPGGVSLGVYRVAQEALTNARKHGGGGARADLRVRYLADAVELEVSDSGVGASARGGAARATNSSSGSGLGHVGMRERVAAVGGSIEIGPRARGGYLVRARFPIAPVAADTHSPLIESTPHD
ncbi:sensor histidine kinase [Microterricola viridarii]|uniref:histidine kinase n=1 Tax=Microterricola viridarii TaxID=412690 RepID=A0A1H1N3V9_9MICO|nr:histidine kinase [Microterricola viridarii]SDR93415.1 Signal transduction histidine kinase [Microterricola viridarii]